MGLCAPGESKVGCYERLLPDKDDIVGFQGGKYLITEEHMLMQQASWRGKPPDIAGSKPFEISKGEAPAAAAVQAVEYALDYCLRIPARPCMLRWKALWCVLSVVLALCSPQGCLVQDTAS